MTDGTICIFTGSADSFNLDQTLLNTGWMLDDEFDLQLLSTTAPHEALEEYFTVFGTDSTSTRAGELDAIRTYLGSNAPDVLMNLTLPPIHGTALALCTLRGDRPTFVHRYSGDRFYEFKPARGFQKVRFFAINNVIGRVPTRLADANVAMGPTGKRRLEERGASNVHVLPPPVDASRFESEPVETDAPTAIFIGRVSRLKGAQTLERIIPEVLQQREEMRFVVVGPAERPLHVEDRYRDHVDVTGAVPPHEIPEYLAGADVLVHPSLTEGLPRVVGEAQLSNTRVIARDVGDIAFATENTFTEENELVEMLTDFERLPLERGATFDRRELQETYVDVFRAFVEQSC